MNSRLPNIKNFSRPAAKRGEGFSLISTLFVLVVLAALGGFMVRLASVQAVTSAMSIQTSRAWFQAVSGMEWAEYEINSTGGCPPVRNPVSQPPNFTSAEGFQIFVESCADSGDIVEATTYRLYNLEVLARYGTPGTVDYTSRKVQATVKIP